MTYVRYKSMLFALGILWMGACVFPASAADFPCGHASTDVEKMICGNSELSELDYELGRSYRKAISRSEERGKLVDGQRYWLKSVRNVCRDVACIKAAYVARINELDTSGMPAAGKTAGAAKEDVRTKRIIGNWKSWSRAFYGVKIELTQQAVTFGDCTPVPYSVVKLQDGEGPRPYLPWLRGRWHEIAVELAPRDKQSSCPPYQVLDFTISDGEECAAGIGMYRSGKDFRIDPDHTLNAWGAWDKSNCAN